ncbi:MAG: MbcA/ParS/Xre antitoxin family protein [Hyphomonas sp.]|uniref:MbcA/ParS/Xre antitoxin family protein n=1 Tax=Hyphomonas sp. TaxID=87 RepID=UPI003296D1CA
METALEKYDPAVISAVALKAYARIADTWSLTPDEAAGLADMSDSAWRQVQKSEYAGQLTEDQLLRLSALIGIYKILESYFSDPIARNWFKRPNTGPLFNGQRPLDTAINEGLSQILSIRNYLDALQEGA